MLALRIAFRYFLAKKSSLVNRISRVSVISISIGAAAMILILSVMNGMNSFISARFHLFDPDIKIEIQEGYFFSLDSTKLDSLALIQGVKGVYPVLEQQAMLQYADVPQFVKIKGVPKGYQDLKGIRLSLHRGNYNLDPGPISWGVSLGAGLFSKLGAVLNDVDRPCKLYLPKSKASALGFLDGFYTVNVYPTAVFRTIAEYDNIYMLAPLASLQKLSQKQGQFTALELSLDSSLDPDKIQASIKSFMGPAYSVKNKDEQQDALYKSMAAEKWIVSVLFAFVLLISSFTMSASLMLLIFEKRKDILVFQAMGMAKKHIAHIFLWEGAFISLSGALMGLVLGGGIALAQELGGFVKLGGSQGKGHYLVDAYPIAVEFRDFIFVFLVVILIGIISSLLPLAQLKSYSLNKKIH